MGQVTRKYWVGVNDRVKQVAEESYNRISQDLHWNIFATVRDISGIGNEVIEVPIEDAELDLGVSETYLAESTSATFSIQPTVSFASRMKTVLRSQVLDGVGAEILASFGRQMGALFARVNEDLVLKMLKENPTTGYDGLATFHNAHKINPAIASKGTFSNDLSGAGFAIDPVGAPDPQVALANLGKAVAAVYSVPTASGNQSRRLVPKYLVVPTALRQRALQLTESAFLGSASGANDVTPLIRSNGLQVVVMPELGAAFGGSDTKAYLVCEPFGELGAFMIGVKEDLQLVYWTPADDTAADEAQTYSVRARGRLGIAPALPYYVFRIGA